MNERTDWYHVNCTVNTPKAEYEYQCDSRDVHSTLERIKQQHPSMTSVVMVIVIKAEKAAAKGA